MKKIVVLLTVCLLLIAMAIPAVAQATTYAAQDLLDYSKDKKKATGVQMGDVLASIEHWTVSEAEKNYIYDYYNGATSMRYDRPGVEGFSYEYDGTTESLTVYVKKYFYTDNAGRGVTWLPAVARIGELSAEFVAQPDKGEFWEKGYFYRADIDNVKWSDILTLTIEYSADFTFSADILNGYVNFAYDRAIVLDQEMAVYEQAYAKYEAAKQAYDAYVAALEQYPVDCKLYETYLSKVELYRDYQAYQNYLARMQKYEQDLAAYQANRLEWQKYESDVIKYNEYLAYKNNVYPGLAHTYGEQKGYVDHHLYLMSLMERSDPVTGISFVSMILDDRIAATIEERRDQFEDFAAGATNEVVDSTHELQRIISRYFSLATDQAKYNYYLKEYDNLVYNLDKLYRNIKLLYENKTVYKLLQDEHPDKIEDMLRMMGSLYVQKCVFDDTVTLNLNEVLDVRGGKRAYELVDASVRPSSDTNKADPERLGVSAWPTAPVDPETYEVTKLPAPPANELTSPKKPALPTFTAVDYPSQIPEYMDDPGFMAEPVPPVEAPHPGQAPKLNWLTSLHQLHDAYEQGLIVQRPEFEGDRVITLFYTAEPQTITLDPNQRAYSVHFYDGDEYLGSSAPVLQGNAASIPPEFVTLTKPGQSGIAYEFVGWFDKDGNVPSLDNMTEDVYVYASFREVVMQYNVTWIVGDSSVVEQYRYGELPTFKGTTEKAPTAQYIYTFDGWDKDVEPVTGDVTYTAQYKETTLSYKVSFTMGEGATVEKEYFYGQSLSEVVASFGKPYINATAQHTYTFTGWQDEAGNFYADGETLPLLTKDMVFTAMFEQTVNKYKVTWIVDGVQSSALWEYGQMPSFGADPFKEADKQYYYTFTGWDKEIVPVTEDAVYTAGFAVSAREYRVTFSVDGIEYTFMLEYGTYPDFEQLAKIKPHKPSDVQYDYEFADWDSELLLVKADALYIANFVGVLRKYPVTFIAGNKEITKEFEYGKLPSYPDRMPTKDPDDQYRYEFAGWSPEIVAVDGSEMTYVAQFTAIPLAPAEDGDHGKLTVDGEGNYNVGLGGNKVDLSEVVDMVGEAQASLQIAFGEGMLYFPKDLITAFYGMGNLAGVSLERVTDQSDVAYRIEMSDKSGTPVGSMMSEMQVKLPYSGAEAVTVFRVEADGKLTAIQSQQENGYVVFSTLEAATFVIRQTYAIGKDATENGTFEVVDQACPGETVTVVTVPAQGYSVDRVTVMCNGQAIEVAADNGAYTFVMPSGDVQVGVTFKAVQQDTDDGSGQNTQPVPEDPDNESDTHGDDVPGKQPEGGCGGNIGAGVLTALLIVAIGCVIAVVLRRETSVKI